MNPSEDAKLLTFTLIEAALKVKELGKSKQEYLEIANDMWDLMDLYENKEALRCMIHRNWTPEIYKM